MKKFLSLFLVAAIFLTSSAVGGAFKVSAADISDNITISGYDKNKDYMTEMMKCLNDGGVYAMQMGKIYEKQRNFKIDALKLKEKKTSYFLDYNNAKDIFTAMEAEKAPKYTQEDLDLLSRIIYAEAGCSWIPDWVQHLVGSVVLNRVESSYYPNNIHDVVYQEGQYEPTWSGSINNTPDKRTIINAKYLLEHGSMCPENVIGQNSIVTGSGVYKSYYDAILNTTIYFCYL